jgi:hypothetical protein
MKRQRIAYRPAWTHHPRGGKITGFAGPIRPGLYGPERGLAATEAAARAGDFFTHAPASQVFPETTDTPTP